jgi:hypothetical protein
MTMTPLEFETIKKLGESVDMLSLRVQKLEEAVNLGRGGFKAMLILAGLIGTILGAIKMFGR